MQQTSFIPESSYKRINPRSIVVPGHIEHPITWIENHFDFTQLYSCFDGLDAKPVIGDIDTMISLNGFEIQLEFKQNNAPRLAPHLSRHYRTEATYNKRLVIVVYHDGRVFENRFTEFWLFMPVWLSPGSAFSCIHCEDGNGLEKLKEIITRWSFRVSQSDYAFFNKALPGQKLQ